MAGQNLFHVQQSTVRSNAEMTNLVSQDLGDHCIVETRNANDEITSQKLYKLKAHPSSILANWEQIGGDGYTGGGGGGSATWPVPGTPATFPPEAHRHVWGDLDSIPDLVSATAGLSGNGVVKKTGASTMATITTTAYGESVLGMADAAALRTSLGVAAATDSLLKANNLSDLTNVATARTNLGLGAAALLGTTGIGRVITTGAGDLISPGDLPPGAITVTWPDIASEAAMLALSAAQGHVALRTDVNQTYILRQAPATTLANWSVLPNPLGGVTSVFGMTGPVVTLSGLPVLSGAIADADQIAILDASSGTHARVTRADFLAGAGTITTVAGDAAKGIAVATASGTATVSIKADGMPSLSADFGSSNASFLVSKTDGTPGVITANALLPALPARTTPADADLVPTSTAAGALGKTTLAQLLTGRTITRPRLVDHEEAAEVFTNASGSVTLPTGQNTYCRTLTGNTTITLPSNRPTTAGSRRGYSVVIDQDATGGRTLTFQAPAGEVLKWSNNGPQPSIDSTANGRTEFVFTVNNGETRIDGRRTF